jgi:hypothetical protein
MSCRLSAALVLICTSDFDVLYATLQPRSPYDLMLQKSGTKLTTLYMTTSSSSKQVTLRREVTDLQAALTSEDRSCLVAIRNLSTDLRMLELLEGSLPDGAAFRIVIAAWHKTFSSPGPVGSTPESPSSHRSIQMQLKHRG